MKTISTFAQYTITNHEAQELNGGTTYMALAVPASFPQAIQDRLSVIVNRYDTLISEYIALEGSTDAKSAARLQQLNSRISLLFSSYVRVITQFERI